MRETTVAASLIADMLGYLERRGLPAAEACRRSGIDPRLLAPAGDGDPDVGAGGADRRVPGSQAERLWPLAVAHTGDALVGLHMAEEFNPGALDIVGYVVLSCRTVGEALERLARYAGLLNDGFRLELVRDREEAYVRCTLVEGMDNYLLRGPGAEGARQVLDTVWAGVARELRALAAEPVAPRAVWFRHAGPPSEAARAEYRRVLGTPAVRFGAPEDRFVVAAADLARPVRSANPALLRAFAEHADAAWAALDRGGAAAAASDRVTRVLARLLRGRVPPLGEVAGELAMSARNLQRALRDEGTSYQALLDDVRRELAVRHLADPAASAGQVAFLLGFSEPSAFHRAFRRWTGRTPSAFRPGRAASGPAPRPTPTPSP
jgi:AraC-like DNA-binding protein